MAYTLDFPQNESQCETALKNLVDTAKGARKINEVEWWMLHYYLQGAREFGALDYARGVVDVNYYNSSGELKFRYDWIVTKFQAQLGRLLQIDATPAVTKRNVGLEDMRKASTGQVAINEAFGPDKVSKLKLTSLPILLKYGTVGFAVWQDGENVGVDVCPPWELLPIPPCPVEQSDERGISRIRIVPQDWVKELALSPGKNSKVWDEMTTFDTQPGQIPTGTQDTFNTFGSAVTVDGDTTEPAGTRKGHRGKGRKDESTVALTEFVEFWTETPEGLLKEYLVTAGGKLLKRQDFTKQRLHMPMTVAHDIPTGGFWGRSFCSVLMPMNVEMEYSLQSLLENVQDLDSFGILFEPTTMGLPTEIMRGSDGLKRARFEPDYSVPDLKPFNIAPANTGTMPVEAIKMTSALGEGLANQPTDMMRGDAPGRVDSQKGLGFLYEVSNMPISPTAESFSAAVTGSYKAIMDIIHTMWDGDKIVQVTLLDDSLAGIVLDPNTGQVKLDKGSIPKAAEVNVSILSLMPKSTEQQKAELKEALEMSTMDMFEYRIEVRKKGLGLPVGGEEEWQNYRRAVMENIVLFGDGKTPGEIIAAEHDMHMVHLRVIMAFMARPEFFAASKEVREVFNEHYQAHMLGDAQGMPDQAMYPEDSAEMEQMNMMNMNGAQGGMSQQQGMGPPGGMMG